MKPGIIFLIIIYYAFFFSILVYEVKPLVSSLLGEDQVPHKRLKIYMYPLHRQLNLDLIWAYGKWNRNIQQEDGLGIQLNVSDLVFDTNQMALEQYFYHRLLHGNYLTTNKSEADLFYIPFFPNLAKVAGQYQIFGKFWAAIKPDFKFMNKTHYKHFMVYGGCQKYAQVFAGPFVKSINVIMLERNANKYQKTNEFVAPYPGQIHFKFNRANEVDYEKKDILVSSVWNSRYPIRWELAGMCKKHPKECVHIELNSNSDVYNHTYAYEVALRSVFCLSPHGDSPTRKGFWDALLVGCINVIFDDTIKYPFDDLFDYKLLAVYIPKAKRYDTFDILRNLPKEEIQKMQRYIETNRIHFQYTNIEEKDRNYGLIPFEKKDAFNLLLDEVYQRSLQGGEQL